MNNVGLELGWNSARGMPLVAENGTHTRFLGDGSLIIKNELLGVIEELVGNVLEATVSFEICVDTSGLVESEDSLFDRGETRATGSVYTPNMLRGLEPVI